MCTSRTNACASLPSLYARFCLIATLLLTFAAPAAAQTIIWSGAAGTGLWTTPGNWDQNRTPLPSDDVLIPLATPLCTLLGDATVNRLDVRGQLEVLGSIFVVTTQLRAFGGTVRIRTSSATMGGIEVLPGSNALLELDATNLQTNALLISGGTVRAFNSTSVEIIGVVNVCPDPNRPDAIAELDVELGSILGALLVDLCTGGELRGGGQILAPVQNNAGRVVPGGRLAAGGLFIAQQYAQLPTAELQIELDASLPVVQHDRLSVANVAMLDGTLRVSLLSPPPPLLGTSLVILTAPIVLGQFSSSAVPNLGSGRSWIVRYLPDRVLLEIVSLPGDLNSDCKVNESDLGILLSCWLTAPCGDLNGDLLTSEPDLGIVLGNWGAVCP